MNTILEHFVVRANYEYATFVVLQRIGDDPGRGYFMLAIESSYGSGYANAWNYPGCDFYDFLCGCDADYLRRKLAPREEFDADKTSDACRDAILRMRREREITAERARELYVSAGFNDLTDFHSWQEECAPDMTDAWELGRSGPDDRGSQFLWLYKAFWPAFCDQLREAKRQREEARAALQKQQQLMQSIVDSALSAANMKLG